MPYKKGKKKFSPRFSALFEKSLLLPKKVSHKIGLACSFPIVASSVNGSKFL
jgi:hypothetical protein